ncbi:uncharacterized protein METZ01_LOCUS60027 [marine metagenome]|uniref:glutamate--cysteine ligase n=1 Tax=marine metagenome TaxID=408172 RepID=A0A381T0K5_9ZZZZ
MDIDEKITSFILSQPVTHQHRKVGMEEECIIYTEDLNRLLVNPAEQYSATDLMNEMNQLTDKNGIYSLEPGGQLEWSSLPYENLSDLSLAQLNHRRLLNDVTDHHNLIVLNWGLEPRFSPNDIDLIDQLKYQLMSDHMGKVNTLGKWMMRNTASIQVNFDITNKQDAEKMVFLADCLHPVCAYLFANSPFRKNEPTGTENIRNMIWEHTDNHRCRNLIDHGINSPDSLIQNYIDYMMLVPGIFQLNSENIFEATDGTLGDQLINLNVNGKIRDSDIQIALHQIFTNVRLKHLVEVRGADRPPLGHELAPVAFWTGLLMAEKTREKALNVVKQWSEIDRASWNKAALNLDSSQIGPNGKTFDYWNKWAGELALEGLAEREKDEELFFEPLFKSVISEGPFSLQTQSDFVEREITLEDYIYEQ